MLNKCFCGETPEELIIEGNGERWAGATCNKCGVWAIDFESEYSKPESDYCIELAKAAWNDAPRVESQEAES